MMRFVTDHYFHIGRAHSAGGKPCQDYALSESTEKTALAIIADGCSGGGNTDVGARMIALATAAAIRQHKQSPEEIDTARTTLMKKASRILHIEHNDLLATCAYAQLAETGGFIHLLGDGAFALKYRDGSMLLQRFTWNNNMPVYAAYADDAYQGFIDAHGRDLTATPLRQEEYEYCPGLGYIQTQDTLLTLAHGIRGITIPLTETQIRNRLEYVAVFSDGVDQVEGMDWKDAIIKLLSFKNTTGEFAKRRMIRFIKESQETGKGPLDDISYAVIHITRGEEKEECHDTDHKQHMGQP